MAYGWDVPLIIAAAVALAIGTLVALIMLLRGPAKKPARGGKEGGKKTSSSSSSVPTKKPTTAGVKKDSSKKVTTTPKTDKKKAATTPKTEKKKAEKDNKKADAKPKAVAVASGTSAVPESPKTVPALSKTEKKKQAKKAAKAAAAVEVREETSAEDLEFARAMSNNAKGVLGKKKEAEAEEAEEAEQQQQQGSTRNWAEINAKNTEVQKFKGKVKEYEKEIADLRRIIDDNKKKMREYNLTNAKLVTERNTQKEAFEEKIARLKADIDAMRDNRDVAVKGGDALRDRNYVVNVLQQERDTYKNKCEDLQTTISQMQKQSEGGSENHVQGLQQQLETLSLERNQLTRALQDAKHSEAMALEKLQAERVNVARLTALLDSKEHAAVEDSNGKEGDEQAST